MKAHPPLVKLLVINFFLIFAAGELEFYQDVEQEPSEADVRLKQLERYLESQSRPRFFRRDHPPPIHRHPYQDDIDYREREKEILEALAENPRILDILEKNKEERYIPHADYNEIEYPRVLNRPHFNLDSSMYDYPKINIPYPDQDINENVYLENSPRYPMRMRLPESESYQDNVESSLAHVQEKLAALHNEKHRNSQEIQEPVSEFTYHFNEPTDTELHDTFAAKPNDPRYFEKVEHVTRREEIHTYPPEVDRQSDETVTNIREENDVKLIQPPVEQNNNNHQNNKITHVVEIMPEPQRRAEKEPIITFTSSKMSNDVYFIAIVAGCSAAAMFALVLISLTWCRLQRGVKAAADIEYPAYGITGPNKDVSPSGDQRLAHSAQMYHFQHQKQQIIAMEKSAASRDPGSVSEAESDEENEEGDYTVYECPGLAPAGEVEVKNPMFHDDPTPATP